MKFQNHGKPLRAGWVADETKVKLPGACHAVALCEGWGQGDTTEWVSLLAIIVISIRGYFVVHNVGYLDSLEDMLKNGFEDDIIWQIDDRNS